MIMLSDQGRRPIDPNGHPLVLTGPGGDYRRAWTPQVRERVWWGVLAGIGFLAGVVAAVGAFVTAG